MRFHFKGGKGKCDNCQWYRKLTTKDGRKLERCTRWEMRVESEGIEECTAYSFKYSKEWWDEDEIKRFDKERIVIIDKATANTWGIYL